MANQKYFDQLSGVRSTQKLVTIHNTHLLYLRNTHTHTHTHTRAHTHAPKKFPIVHLLPDFFAFHPRSKYGVNVSKSFY